MATASSPATTDSHAEQAARLTLITQAMMGLALVAVLSLHLLSALLAGLLIYQLVQATVPLTKRLGVMPRLGKVIVLILVPSVMIAAITVGVLILAAHLHSGSDSAPALLQKLADVVAMARNYLPPSLQDELPASVEEWQSSLATWLRDNAGQLSHVGRTVGVSLVHILVGMIIGGMVAFSHEIDAANRRPLAKAMVARVSLLNNAFHRIVFSQVRISALNTVLTGLFLTVVMPLVGSPLPFTKTMIVVTFVAGLLPVIGNLISNTVIVLISLSVSLPDAIGALVFLVLIHKLEYFLNARIIGGRISARAWELLIAMLVMEAAFGLPGLIAAPIYYAYLKDELSAQKLI
ncbi:MAG: AI-2E family transporter [Holosporaceae bacterium]|jgi:predicted PurR-regulated permease PerM|nr:hypothetical protein [Rhodospirillaceae bacterium]